MTGIMGGASRPEALGEAIFRAGIGMLREVGPYAPAAAYQQAWARWVGNAQVAILREYEKLAGEVRDHRNPLEDRLAANLHREMADGSPDWESCGTCRGRAARIVAGLGECDG